MSLALATFAPNDPINATVLRDLLDQMRIYANEGIIAADRASGWMTANHVYAPDFIAGPNAHTTLTSGEVYYRRRDSDTARAAYYSQKLGNSATSAFFPITGMGTTICIPENINTNGGHRVRVHASVYVYEWGGDDDPANVGMSEDDRTGVGGGGVAGTVDIIVNGANVGLYKPFHKGSITGATEQICAFYPRKQISFTYSVALNRGVHSISLGINPRTSWDPGVFKHCVVVQGNFDVQYFCR